MKNISERILKWWKKATAWWAIYHQTCSKRHLAILIIVTSTIYIFYIPVKSLLLTNFIKPIFGDLPNNDTLRSFIVLFSLLFSIYYFTNHLWNKRLPTIDSFFNITSISCAYFFLFRPDKDFYYFRFFSFDIYLSDLIWLSLLFIIPDYQLITLPLKQDNSYLLEDDTSQDEINNDLLYRNSFSKTIANVINNTTPEKAIAIAILAKWGFGKTVFLRQLEKELENDNSTNIVLQFNPWKVDGNVNIIQVFFEELSEKLAKYDHSAIKNFKNYAQKLSYNTDNDLAIIKLAKSLFGSFFFNQLSITKQHDEIDSNIKRIGKRVIVLIDDLDRLSGDELAPIMRLIRNVADFQNVIFVAAFDRSYVTSALSKTEKLTNEEKYLEKIFQVEIPLPPIKSDIVAQELERLIAALLKPNHLIELQGWVSSQKHDDFFRNDNYGARDILKIINGVLLNIRDVRRFVNSFKITYELTKEELLFEDIFVLELIKFTSIYVYDMLAHMELIEDTNRTYLKLSEEKLESIFKNQEDKNIVLIKNKETIKLAISFLYSHEELNGGIRKENFIPLTRPLVRRQNHYYYFNYQLFGAISMKEFREASESNIESLIKLIDSYQGQLNDYLEIVRKAKQLPFDNILKNIINSIWYCYKYTDRIDTLNDIIISFISTQYNLLKEKAEDFNKFKDFIENELLSNNVTYYFSDSSKTTHIVRSSVALSLLQFHLRNRSTNESAIDILNIETLIQINKTIFYDYIKNKKHKEDIVYSLLLNNWFNIESSSNEIVLNNDICLEYSTYLKTNYRWYIQNLIRPYMIPETVTYQYTFDPFIRQIFGGYNEFELFLNSLPESDCIKYNKQKYLEFKENNLNPIIIKDFRTKSPCLSNE